MLNLLAAGISGVGSIVGGLMGSSAAKNAAYAQTRGNNQAASKLQAGNYQAANVLAPYSNEGAGARSLYNAALGVPQAQGGASTVANEQSIYQQLLQDRPDVAAEALKQSQSKKSQFYGSDPITYAKYWVQNFGGQDALEAAKQKVQTTQATNTQAGPTQADASQVFQGTQYAKDASKLGNALWQPVGGEQATFEQSPWQGITDRATAKANDLFLGLAGARGSAISGNTARGLQENAANINDGMYGNYLNAYNNAATGNYNASTNAFDKWMSGLGGVADTGYNADQTVAGNAANQGSQMAELATGKNNAAANGVVNSSNAQQNALSGVFNAIGQTTQEPKNNALYTGQNQQSAAPVRVRSMLNPSIVKAA